MVKDSRTIAAVYGNERCRAELRNRYPLLAAGRGQHHFGLAFVGSFVGRSRQFECLSYLLCGKPSIVSPFFHLPFVAKRCKAYRLSFALLFKSERLRLALNDVFRSAQGKVFLACASQRCHDEQSPYLYILIHSVFVFC